MATWHQRRAGTRLWHDTLWTMVSDPPNEMTTLERFETKPQAEARLMTLKSNGKGDHCYLLPPATAAR